MKHSKPRNEKKTGAVSLDAELAKRYVAFCTDDSFAKKILYKEGEFYQKLISSPAIDFIIFKGNDGIIGGQYLLDISGNDIEEIKAGCVKKIENLFLEAIPCIESGERMMIDMNDPSGSR